MQKLIYRTAIVSLTALGLVMSGMNTKESSAAGEYTGKKLLYIDSYHAGYPWSDGITKGITGTLKDTGVELKIIRMDTKRNKSTEFKKEAALKAKTAIEEFKPDVVIASDDNASKYLIMPYYRDAGLPFVFCGLNWDASAYGYPYRNVTGMVEVSLFPGLHGNLKRYAKGNRIGFLAEDNLTDRKEFKFQQKMFNVKFHAVHFVSTFQEWKDAFKKFQEEVDMLILENNASIIGWDDTLAEDFVLKHVKIPTGTPNAWMMPVTLIGLIKIPEEQGQWAAQTALKILNGTPPSEISMTQNRKGKLFINVKIGNKLGVTFPRAAFKYGEVIK